MKKFVLILFCGIQVANAQSVVSSCSAPDSIITKYTIDAQTLALRKIFRQNLPEKDSVYIPQSHTDTILKALLAVYNATDLPARDTVISMYNIHSFPELMFYGMTLMTSDSVWWAQQLRAGITPTGNSDIDNLLTQYNFSVDYHMDLTLTHRIIFHLVTDTVFNMQVIANEFAIIDSIQSVEVDHPVGDGNDIVDSIYSDHVELFYSYGSGDCPSGCMSRRYWKFNVYFDCSVAFVGSSGDIWSSMKEVSEKQVSVYPNPFSDKLTIEPNVSYQLFDLVGREINRNNLSELPVGVYILKTERGSTRVVKTEK